MIKNKTFQKIQHNKIFTSKYQKKKIELQTIDINIGEQIL